LVVLKEYDEYTNILAHIKGLTRDFLYQFQDEKAAQTQRVEYEDEISWGVSSTIITYSLHLWFIPMDRVFTPHKVFQRYLAFPPAFQRIGIY
jgi:hypothetical protein